MRSRLSVTLAGMVVAVAAVVALAVSCSVFKPISDVGTEIATSRAWREKAR